MDYYVKFLKDCNVWRNFPYLCGEGCCLNDYWDSDDVVAGDIIMAENVDLSNLKIDEDYVLLDHFEL